MICFFYALGGFFVGLLAMALFVIIANRKAEQEDFLAFWGPP